MLKPNIRVLVSSCVACILLWQSFFLQTHAAREMPATQSPRMQVVAGFDSRYRDGHWVPVQLSLSNDAADFTGTISITVSSSLSPIGPDAGSPSTRYQEAISLPSGAQKHVTMYVPLATGLQGTTQNLTVDLLDSTKQTVNEQKTMLHSLGPSDLFVGILSDQSTGFGPLAALSLPNPASSILTEQFNASTFPSLAEALKNFDLLVLDNFTTDSLSQEQLQALTTWVMRGGSLVEVGGPEWRHTLGPLPDELLPALPTGTTTLPGGTRLLPIGAPAQGGSDADKHATTVPAPLLVSAATTKPESTPLLSSSAVPLLVQGQVGQGQVLYLAYDPTLAPLGSWSGAGNLWKGLLLRTLGEQLLASTPGQGPGKFSPDSSGTTMIALLQALFPTLLPSGWLLFVLFLTYVVALGPLRFWLVRRLKSRAWSWRITLCTILLFSLLSFGLAFQQKEASRLSSRIAVIQLSGSQGEETTAHETDYMAFFVPSQSNFQVHLPARTLLQPLDDLSQYSRTPLTSHQTTINSVPNGTEAALQGSDLWTLHALISQQDRLVQGGLTSHLTLLNGSLVGSITNHFAYALNDAYVLMGNNHLFLGRLAAQQTQQVRFPALTNISQPMALADQIALSQGLPTPYIPYSGAQTLTETQRHAAVLATLSGENNTNYYCAGSSCAAPPIGNSSSITVFPHKGLSSSLTHDPLLIAGSPATLIGWMDTSSGGSAMTINGQSSPGSQESLIQAPLDTDFSGAVTIDPSLVGSQLVDIQSTDRLHASSRATPLLQAPRVYTMTTGSMTFEFTLPIIPHLHAQRLTLTEDGNAPQMFSSPGTGQMADASHLHATLYNWRTGSWTETAFRQFAVSLQNAQEYVGPAGRVLLHLSNSDPAQGTILFNRPALTVQGSVIP